jgi:hypothetical protein
VKVYEECLAYLRPLQFTPPGATIFEESVGHFWGIVSTRPYMQSRYALVESLLLIKGQWHPVEEAHDHIKDMLRLSRSDNGGVRSLLAPTMLRLSRDQDCYDLVKW